jgi:hypothetical protein
MTSTEVLARRRLAFSLETRDARPYPAPNMYESIRAFETESSTRTELRRAALVTILEDRAEPILDRIVADALRATDFVGLGGTVAARYATIARKSLPLWLTALGAMDPQRARILDDNAHLIKEIVAQGIPKFVQRSFVSWGFKAANGIARDGARAEGFEPDELEDELRVFQRAFEARLFFGL